MANKVLCVEVGYSFTKVCEMDYKTHNARIYNRFELPTPQGVIVDGVIHPEEQFVRYLKIKMKEEKIKTKKVIFSIASSKIATREAKIPYCKENRIPDVVRANLEEYFPFDSSQYLISHSILGLEMPEEDADKKGKVQPTGYKLLLVAVPKQVIESYRLLAKALELEFETTDFMVNSIYQAAKEDSSEGIQMIVKADEKSSLMLVMKDGNIVMNRSIPYGVDEGITKDGFNAEKVMPALSGIARVVDYYASTHSREPLEQICVTGLGADSEEFIKLLGEEIGISARKLKIVAKVTAKSQEKEISNQFISCIGAAVSPLVFYTDKPEEGETKGKGVDKQMLAVAFLIVCAVASLVLVIATLLPYLSERKKKENYEAIITDLQPVYDTYLSYKTLLGQVDQLKALDNETKNRNEELVDFIRTLENNMPATFCLNDMTATTEGITLNVTVATKEEAAVVLDELGKLTSFSFVDTNSINELTTEIGETQYSFTVDMIYAPIEEETTEEE